MGRSEGASARCRRTEQRHRQLGAASLGTCDLTKGRSPRRSGPMERGGGDVGWLLRCVETRRRLRTTEGAQRRYRSTNTGRDRRQDMRKRYEMSPLQLEKLLDTCRRVIEVLKP